MKDMANLTETEFRNEVLETIHREYGLDGLARFLMVFCSGKGDYTRDRHKWLDDKTVEQIIADSQARAA